jgi:eukaryotic-like serine/threonine-protein kinase
MRINVCLVLSFALSLIVFSTFPQGAGVQLKTLPKVKWKFQTGAVYGSPIIDGSTVYIASLANSLHALDLESGKERWKWSAQGPMRSTPLIQGEAVYITSEDGALYKLDKSTGKLIWQYITPQGTLQERKYDKADYYQSSPSFNKEKIYFGMGDYLYVVDAAKGTTVWTYKTGNVVHCKPTFSNGKVLFGSYDGFFYALDAESGNLVWKFKSVGQRYFPNGEMMGDPIVMGNTVFVGSRDYNFYAINVNSGYCHWNKQFPKGWALAATIHKDSVLYLGTSDDYVMLALDPRTGQEQWRAPLKYNIFGAMKVIEGNVGLVGTLMGKLFAIDLNTGKILWTFEGESYKKNRNEYFTASEEHKPEALSKFSDFSMVVKMYHDLGAIFGSPACSGNVIIYAGTDGMVYTLSR